MTPYSSDREKYNTGYFGWFVAYSKYWISLPSREIDIIMEWLQTTGALVIYIICTLLSPIVFPILAMCIMISSKKRMLKIYGKEELKQNN